MSEFQTVSEIIAERDALRAVNAELVEALKGLVCAMDNGVWGMVPDTMMETEMRAALAKAKDLKGTE